MSRPVAYALLVLCLTTVPCRSAAQSADRPEAEPEQPAAQPDATSATPPRLLQFFEARYPSEALKDGLQATVELEITIDAQGKVAEARVVSAAGHGFDEAALEAVKRFVFEPARLGGNPVAARVRYPYVFEIREVAQLAVEPAPAPGRLAGRILDRQDDSPVERAEIHLSSEDGSISRRAVAGEQGEFEFAELAPGVYVVRVFAADFADFEQRENLASGQATQVVYRLDRTRDQYAFSATARVPPPPREVTRHTIERQQLTRVAGTRGDPLRTVEILPGVARPPFSAGELIVRGSAPYDTQTLFEGLPVELLYHFGALTSFVHPRLVDSIDFYPGNFSVRYGRALGGILEARAADLQYDAFHGVADVNLLDASLLLNIPVAERAGLVLAGRRSYIDLILANAFSSDTFNVTAAPVYYDYQAVGAAQVGDRDRLRLMIYGSSDRFKVLFEQPEEGMDEVGNLDLSLQFHRAHASWSRPLSGSVDQEVDLAVGTFDPHFSLGEDLYFDIHYVQIYGRSEWRARLSPRVRVIGGLDLLSGPGKVVYTGPRLGQQEGGDHGEYDESQLDQNQLNLAETFTVLYPAAYLESDLDLKPARVVLGLRVDYYNDIDKFSFDPRLAAFYTLTEQVTLKAGVGLFSQPPQGYESYQEFGNPELLPNRALHLSAGADWRIVEGVSVGLEGFYKYLFQRVVATEYGQPPYFINYGIGRIFGLELLAKAAPRGRFFGYLAYTLSRSERKDRDERWRLFDYDQPHILTASGVYRLGRGWELGATFRLVSGNPMTPILGGVNNLNTGDYSPIWGRINSARSRLFHRLDIRVEKLWKFQYWSLAVYLDLQNAYWASNQEGLVYDYRYEKSSVLTGLPILPVLGVRGEM